ncbi:hypothetical protein [Sporisorium scitamineum]|nr:hypothetical protein [Sporisorium scitamineum]
MEQERLGRMGIAYPDGSDSDDRRSDPNGGSRLSKLDSSKASRVHASSWRNMVEKNGKEQQLTVKALSPTIPSFLWSSPSESADSDDDARDEVVDAKTAEQRLAASITTVGADEEEKQLALDILQRDIGDGTEDQAPKPKGRITFYRAGKVLAPTTTFFCPLPSVTKSTTQGTQTSSASTGTAITAAAAADTLPASDEIEWITLARHILLAGFLPPSLDLDKRQIRRILVWLSISFILEHDVMQSRLISTLFQSLVFESAKSHYRRQLRTAVPKALTDVARRIPHILNRLGMDVEVLEQCFPDNSKVTDVPLFTVAQRKQALSQAQQDAGSGSSPSAEFTEFKVYLTQAERDDILINLARMVDILACGPDPSFVSDNLTILAGYVSSMAIACATTTSFALANTVGVTFTSVFTAAAREGDETLRGLQERVCRRTFSGLGSDAIGVRARVVTVFPGEGREVGAVRRWLAWCALTEHVAQTRTASPSMSDVVPSSDPFADEGEEVQQHRLQEEGETAHWRRTKFEPLSLDLDMLVAAIDAGDTASPFYVAPSFTVDGANETPATTAAAEKKDDDDDEASPTATSHQTTDFKSILAATQLLAQTLQNLPIHMCTFLPTDRSTLHPSTTTNRRWTRTLRLALTPFIPLNPTLNQTRLATLHTIVQRLAHVNSRIRDNTGSVILQMLAKDALQRTGLGLEYQLEMYGVVDGGAGSFIQ